MIKNGEKRCQLIWHLFVFGFLFVWFTQIHPLVLFDSDDWSFVSFIRLGIPEWGGWNPARVLPETLMPLVCSGAVHLLYPWTGDYIGAVMVGCALTVSLFITVYIYCFTKLVERVFSMKASESITVSALFFLLHFLALLSEESSNQYMFYCWDLTCYFFYLIPAVLNASLVMVMTKNDRFDEFWHTEGNRVKKGFFLLCLYLAIFFNLPASGILAAFAGCKVLFALLGQIRNRTSVKAFLKHTYLYFGILIFWLASALFELSGGRADAASGGAGEMIQGIKNILEALSHPTVYSNKTFMLLVFLILLVMIPVWFRNRKDKFSASFFQLMAEFAVCGAALLVYLILLMAKVSWTSVERNEYLFGLFFYLLLLVLCALCYVIKKIPNSVIALPILLYVLLTCTNTVGETFQESNTENYPAELCAGISRDLVEQFIQADEAGLEHFELYVPVFSKELNWPLFAGDNGFAIGDSLYEHGITSRRIEFTAVSTMEKNEEHQLTLFW